MAWSLLWPASLQCCLISTKDTPITHDITRFSRNQGQGQNNRIKDAPLLLSLRKLQGFQEHCARNCGQRAIYTFSITAHMARSFPNEPVLHDLHQSPFFHSTMEWTGTGGLLRGLWWPPTDYMPSFENPQLCVSYCSKQVWEEARGKESMTLRGQLT